MPGSICNGQAHDICREEVPHSGNSAYRRWGRRWTTGGGNAAKRLSNEHGPKKRMLIGSQSEMEDGPSCRGKVVSTQCEQKL